MEVYTYNPSYSGVMDRRIMVWARPYLRVWEKTQDPIW
jgi:hypothetical protein